jgi:hypothetical protein
MLGELIIPVCQDWIHEEYFRGFTETDIKQESFATFLSPQKSKIKSDETALTELEWKSLFNSYSEGYEAKKMMMQMLKVSGKAEIYADFLYFICTGSVRYE